MNIRPNPKCMHALQDFPVLNNKNALHCVLGMFAYYAKWISCFATKMRPLAEAKTFPFAGSALDAFVSLKSKLLESSLQSIDKLFPFVVECDASDVPIFASLNQGRRLVAFMSWTLQGSKKYYLTYKREATAVFDAVKKWSHLLSCHAFTLIMDQHSVSFMLDSQQQTKSKNDKVQLWCIELAPFLYAIQYCPGKRNVAPNTLTRAYCSTANVASFTSSCILQDIHNRQTIFLFVKFKQKGHK